MAERQSDAGKPESSYFEAMGAMGGKARAEKLSPEERSESARRAAEARWARNMPIAAYGDFSSPLRIGAVELPCFVLNDEKRVLTLNGMLTAMGMKRGAGEGGEGGNRLARFATGKSVSSYISEGVREQVVNPIRFNLPGLPGGVAYGYEATILADLCEAVLAARADGALMPHQMHIALRCEILVRAFARVGIIALVDEATGFQKVRARKALEEILERFIAKELLKWVKVFPDEFYEQLFRLKGWHYIEKTSKRPIQAGKLTVDLVYDRLAPGVLEELKRITPRDDKGRLKHKYHQRLTEEVGHPRLREHLAAIIALMRASDDWTTFYRSINRALPVQIQLPLFDTTWKLSADIDADEPDEHIDTSASSSEPGPM